MPSTGLIQAMGRYNGELAEAVEWVKRCPNPMLGPSQIEIRPIFEYEDFAEAMPPNRSSKKSKCAKTCTVSKVSKILKLTPSKSQTLKLQSGRDSVALSVYLCNP